MFVFRYARAVLLPEYGRDSEDPGVCPWWKPGGPAVLVALCIWLSYEYNGAARAVPESERVDGDPGGDLLQ